ncbi:MAG TPA: hypothetical protein VIO64_14780 [Pseudobacteroides sp.]|uniref:hypothetical protein n=1 Tax=Pseudobacteroides sp. TaxID=1968840 RepID=UPI002F935CA4
MSEIKNNKLVVFIISAAVLVVLLCTAYVAIQNFQPKDIYILSYEDLDKFNFKLNFNTNGKYQIDTYKGTFTKDLVKDGTKTIEFKLPDNIKKSIYDLMRDIDIMSFPTKLDLEGTGIMPSCDYKLTVTIGSKSRTIEWSNGLYPEVNNIDLSIHNKNFLKLVKYISDYIYSTDEYKNMPEANGAYL